MLGDLKPVFQLALLMAAAWGAGVVAEEQLGWPALVAEIFVGMLLGPDALNLAPFEGAVKAVGYAGLLLLVLEGGLNIDLATLRRVGWKAFAIALSGTILPVLAAVALLAPLAAFGFTESLVAGTALSSTAIGARVRWSLRAPTFASLRVRRF
jgi:Kef-type K+ transport system membrane component KefB